MPFTDDEFPGSSLDAKWLWINQGPATATVANGQLQLSAPSSGSDQIRYLYQAYTGGIIVTAPLVHLSARWTNYQIAGFGWRDSASGKFSLACWAIDSVPCLEILRYSSATAINSLARKLTLSDLAGYVQLEDDGTDLIVRLARFGSHGDAGELTFIEVYRETRAGWLTAADQIGFMVNPLNADTTLLSRWVRTGADPVDDEVAG